ncbi:MAG: hypothetical protein IPL28_05230 [Chloroflexi bacterium]|nr:hypothetical protein [Chloroflexota bacterium]
MTTMDPSAPTLFVDGAEQFATFPHLLANVSRNGRHPARPQRRRQRLDDLEGSATCATLTSFSACGR